MRLSHLVAPSLLAASLVACASPPAEPLPRLESLTDLQVDYDASVAARATNLVEDEELDALDLSDVEQFIDVSCSVVELSNDQITQLLGVERYAPWAVTAGAPAVRQALDRLDEDLLTEQRLTVASGQRGRVVIVNQTAFIERFDVERTPQAAIADPVIGVAQDGVLLDFVGSVDDGEVALELHVQANRLQRPVATAEVQLPGAFAPVTIQQPITATQSLDVAPRLKADGALVVALPVVGDFDRCMVVFLSARPVRPSRELDASSTTDDSGR